MTSWRLQSDYSSREHFFGPPRGAAQDDAALRGADEVDQVLDFADTPASDRARICCSALVVFSFDCSR